MCCRSQAAARKENMFITRIEPKGKTKLTFFIQEEEGAEEMIFTLPKRKAAGLGLPMEMSADTFLSNDLEVMDFGAVSMGMSQAPVEEGMPTEKAFSIADPMWQEILVQLRSEALHRCGDLLGRKDYSRAGLESKLEADGYPEMIRQQVLTELTDAHYLDDRRLAENYIRGHLRDKSKARIRQDLQQKGISQTEVEEAFAAISGETDMESQELSQIRRLLEKKHYDPARATWEEKQKVMAFLYRRGFSQDMIRRGMDSAEDES